MVHLSGLNLLLPILFASITPNASLKKPSQIQVIQSLLLRILRPSVLNQILEHVQHFFVRFSGFHDFEKYFKLI